MRYDVNAHYSLSNGEVSFDMTNSLSGEAMDGMNVVQQGNVHSTGRGGLWILSPERKHLCAIKSPEESDSMPWGDDDGKTCDMAAARPYLLLLFAFSVGLE